MAAMWVGDDRPSPGDHVSLVVGVDDVAAAGVRSRLATTRQEPGTLGISLLWLLPV